MAQARGELVAANEGVSASKGARWDQINAVRLIPDKKKTRVHSPSLTDMAGIVTLTAKDRHHGRLGLSVQRLGYA
jgi:hypothetical protein